MLAESEKNTKLLALVPELLDALSEARWSIDDREVVQSIEDLLSKARKLVS